MKDAVFNRDDTYAPDGMVNLCRFTLINTVRNEHIGVFLPADDTELVAVVVLWGIGPNEYEQRWTYRGGYARFHAVNKCLSYMGFGELEWSAITGE